MAPYRFVEGPLGILGGENPAATIIHSSRMRIKSAQLLKNGTLFPQK